MKNIIIGAGVLIFLGLICFQLYPRGTTVGSVAAGGNEYQATSTAPNSVYGAFTSGARLLKTGQGALGSVIITGAGAGVLNFYDATTTVISQRITSTSTVLIASIPASAAAGTYTFDAEFTDGLIVDIQGTMPTTTITYR